MYKIGFIFMHNRSQCTDSNILPFYIFDKNIWLKEAFPDLL